MSGNPIENMHCGNVVNMPDFILMSFNLLITWFSCCCLQAAGPQAEISHSRPPRVIPRGGLAAVVAVGEDQCRLSNTDLAECATVDTDNSDVAAVCIMGHFKVQNCLLIIFQYQPISLQYF